MHILLYEACPEDIQSCNIKVEAFIEEDTRNIVRSTMRPQFPSK